MISLYDIYTVFLSTYTQTFKMYIIEASFLCNIETNTTLQLIKNGLILLE